jgi:hypothetical protein
MKSSLVTMEKLSVNRSDRTEPISRLTVHHAAGVIGLANLLNIFVFASRKASCNYAIDSEGNIGLCVPENYRAWTSSSAYNDQRAITIEVSNSTTAPEWKISDKAEEAIVKLAVDICKRYKLKGLYFDPDKDAPDKKGWLRVTYHNWFKATLCPGPYVEKIMPRIIEKVNKELNPGVKELWRVQVGAYSVEANAKAMAERLKKAGFDTYIVKY